MRTRTLIGTVAKAPSPPEIEEPEILAALKALETNCLHIRKTPRPDGDGAQGCWLGRRPTLPSDLDWPHIDWEDEHPIVPMHFWAQIDLASVPDFEGRPAMPTSGTLFIFVEPVYAPIYSYIDGGSKVLFSNQDLTGVEHTPVPAGLPLDFDLDPPAASGGYEDNPTSEFERWNFTFEPMKSCALQPEAHPEVFRRASLANFHAWQAMEQKTSIDRDGEGTETGAKSMMFGSHSMFDTVTPFDEFTRRSIPEDKKSPTERYVNFLTVFADRDDLNFALGYDDDARFWISQEALAQGDFSGAFVLGYNS